MGARDFDPVALADAEFAGWVAYYRRQWLPFLGAAMRMVAGRLGLSWLRTVRGAWYVLRANQAWAPYPGNDPAAAREYMRRFYELVVRDGGLDLDPAEAGPRPAGGGGREVEWWRVHRTHPREAELTEDDLTGALVELYAYVYDAPPDAV